MTPITNTYHSCQVTTTVDPDGEVWDGDRLLCDGFSHEVTKDGVVLGQFDTLGKAIACTRSHGELIDPQPYLDDDDSELLELYE